MVNPDRLHNAFAALDILARADSTAFAARRSDAAHTKGRVRIKSTGRLVDVTMGESKVWDANGNEWAYSEVEKQGNGRSDAFTRGRNVGGEVMHDADSRASETIVVHGKTFTIKQTGPKEWRWEAGTSSRNGTGLSSEHAKQNLIKRLASDYAARSDATAPFGYTEIWTEDGLDQEVTHQGNYKQIIAREKKDLEKMGCRVRLKHFDAAGKSMARLDDNARGDAAFDRARFEIAHLKNQLTKTGLSQKEKDEINAQIKQRETSRGDAAPSDLSDEAIRLRMSILNADIKSAARNPRADVTKLRKQLEAFERELRNRKMVSRGDAPGSSGAKRQLAATTRPEYIPRVGTPGTYSVFAGNNQLLAHTLTESQASNKVQNASKMYPGYTDVHKKLVSAN